ncbi:hypothetical protein DSO57_1010636 [Entomophthora muscae]|uniref:Uncharacterized protein n=1 Tax=Entomophthora muscae TaxID=34485 RepID=A0ACC2S895_9FUNG|nr:hypothetical protein DSO57_1010636 [Entomophthora muscae]
MRSLKKDGLARHSKKGYPKLVMASLLRPTSKLQKAELVECTGAGRGIQFDPWVSQVGIPMENMVSNLPIADTSLAVTMKHDLNLRLSLFVHQSVVANISFDSSTIFTATSIDIHIAALCHFNKTPEWTPLNLYTFHPKR